MVDYSDIIVWVFTAVFGMCIFSFLNVLIWRVPRGMQFTKGFSMCTTCRHRLYAKDLVPVFSYLFLRGKCRYCGSKISPRYMIVELLGSGCALACLHTYGLSLTGAIVFAFMCILTVIAFVDADTMTIPDSFLIGAGIVAILSAFTGPYVSLPERLIGAACISIPMLILTLIIGGAFGDGDIILMVPAGFMLGWKCVLVAFLIAILLGGAWGNILLLRKKAGMKSHMPFGPFLAIGIGASLLYGNAAISAYMSFLGVA